MKNALELISKRTTPPKSHPIKYFALPQVFALWMDIMESYLSVVVLFGIALVFALGFIGLSQVFGPKNPTKTKLSTYECGHNPIGSARERFGVKFYLVAILFIIFDIEVVFLYPWALNYKEALANGEGLLSLGIIGIFFVMLVIGLIYEWKSGALDWNKNEKSRHNAG